MSATGGYDSDINLPDTGIWKNKEFIDCSGDPNYPAAQVGDAYTVSLGGKIGGNGGIEVESRDVIYCLQDSPDGTQGDVGHNWGILQANLGRATEHQSGHAPVATQVETDAGLIDDRMITPLKLQAKLNSSALRFDELEVVANQQINGLPIVSGRNKYVSVGGNLIIGRDIFLKVGTTIPVNYPLHHIMNLPKPAAQSSPLSPMVFTSSEGNTFNAHIDEEGRLFLQGIFTTANEELPLNFNPYIAEFPLVYWPTKPTPPPPPA